MPDISSPFQVAENIIQTVGWMAVIAAAVGAWRWSLRQQRTHDAAKRAIEQIDVLATNHFPHMQASMEQTSSSLEKQTELLQGINTGIQVLVDRGRQ